jgi:hypothetical protein
MYRRENDKSLEKAWLKLNATRKFLNLPELHVLSLENSSKNKILNTSSFY